MPSLWGKEFLIFWNVVRYAVVGFLVVYLAATLLRLAREWSKRRDDNGTKR